MQHPFASSEPANPLPVSSDQAFAKLSEVQGEIQVVKHQQDRRVVPVQKAAAGVFCSAEHANDAATQRIVLSRTKNGKNPYAFWSLADQHTLVLHHFCCGQIIRAVANSDWNRQKQSPLSPTRGIPWCRVYLKPNGKFLNPEKSQGRVSGFCGCQREGGKLYIDFLQAWINFPNTYSSRKSKEKRETDSFLLDVFHPEDNRTANTLPENQIVPYIATQPSQDLGSFRRLDQFARTALQYASWHRRGKNYGIADWHLRWVEYYFEQHKLERRGIVPAAHLAELHCQSALIRFYPLIRNNPNPEEAVLSQMVDEMNLGLNFASEAKSEAKDGKGANIPCHFHHLINLRGLVEIERAKFLQNQGNSKETFVQALASSTKLASAREEILGETNQLHLGPSSQLTMYALSRNQFLLLREAIKSGGSSKLKIRELQREALKVCHQGIVHVDQSHGLGLHSDFVEMRHCLAEAYFVNKQYDVAADVCEMIYNWSIGEQLHDKIRVIRVLAIWIASLRSILYAAEPAKARDDYQDVHSTKLLDAVLAFFHHHRRGIEVGLTQNREFLTNARFFLSKETSTDERDQGVSDSYFLPKPLLPPEHLREADNILQTIEDRVAARSIQQRN